MIFRKFQFSSPLIFALFLSGCHPRHANDPLPPDVEAYALERTPAVYEKFQEARAKLQRIAEGKTLLAADLKKLHRNGRDDPMMQGMLAHEKSVEEEIQQLRELLESNYLRERKFLLGLTSEGVPSSSDRTTSRTSATQAAPTSLRAATIKEKFFPLSYYTQQAFIPESLKDYQPTEAEPFTGQAGDRCWTMARYVIETGDGLYAIQKGTQLEILGLEDSFIVIVTDGKRPFRVPASLLTTEKTPRAEPRLRLSIDRSP